MNNLLLDSPLSDDLRRERLYQGDFFVFSPRPTTMALCDLARQLAAEAFAPYDPPVAQFEMPVEEYVRILAELKPRFIHHPTCKQLIPELLRDLGCDAHQTYFDVPRLRTVTAQGYLTSGLGYAFQPHRDTWYSPPMCQLNWWLPIYEIEPENAMAFHPRYWDQPVENSSAEFNYQDWQVNGRPQAATQIGRDTRQQAAAQEPLDLNPQLRIVCPPGGMIVFSAAHLHSTVPNTSNRARFSIDFRTVHLDEVADNSGAPNLDSACRGTTIRDYLSCVDLTILPSEVIARYESGELENVHCLRSVGQPGALHTPLSVG